MLSRVTLIRRLIIGLGADINSLRPGCTLGQFAAELMPTSASGLTDVSSCGYFHGVGKGQEFPNFGRNCSGVFVNHVVLCIRKKLTTDYLKQ